MLRFEKKGMFVRYDGIETRVWVSRSREGKGLDKEEIRELILVLEDALDCREAFDLVIPKPGKEPKPEPVYTDGLADAIDHLRTFK